MLEGSSLHLLSLSLSILSLYGCFLDSLEMFSSLLEKKWRAEGGRGDKRRVSETRRLFIFFLFRFKERKSESDLTSPSESPTGLLFSIQLACFEGSVSGALVTERGKLWIGLFYVARKCASRLCSD